MALQETLAGASQVASVARALHGVERLVTVGSGPDRSPARELALKIEEGVWLPARMLDLETILHGHLAACDERTGLVLMATGGDDRVLARARMMVGAARRVGVRVSAIVSRAVDRSLSDLDLERVALSESLEPYGLVGRFAGTALALQQLTLALSRLAGTNPDLIRRQQEPYREAARVAETPPSPRPWGRGCDVQPSPGSRRRLRSSSESSSTQTAVASKRTSSWPGAIAMP